MLRKSISIFLIILFLLNSSLLTVVSTAVEDTQTFIEENMTKLTEVENSATQTNSNDKKEKISLNINYTKLTNRIPNELIITGILEKDTEDCALYDNPVVYFEFPEAVEKVVVNDIKILYDDELKLKNYIIEDNSTGNKVLKVELEGTQTKYSTDSITKGTNIRVSTNIILKQDIETGADSIKMSCNSASTNQAVLLVNSTDNEIINDATTDDEEGTIVYANGLMINTKAIRGTEILEDGSTIH